ncbi:MAG: hypothetical protein LBH74_05940 [Nitrososphaerota archaeon]|uniref:hypothetical protein n=1 Tax=Candidatus Bathycorpusculum sp. TaxID=2994959 RepID=UPI0028329A90|nr:hypothetical protein [Candidatus Termitimicrobium sp.]MCL2432608.1 hypothetical protein [Candidatus Termitimicrobium sp.]MDR0493158.1 hypothetical protein [Nitrososphaerota archaeon]
MSTKRYVCTDKQITPPKTIKEGALIFLYSPGDNNLIGPFTALSDGAEKLDAGAWAMDVNPHIPSEDLTVTWENLHIIQNAREQLPFLAESTICRLSTSQTQLILDLLKQSEPYLNAKAQ